uniref:Defensin-like cystein-rich peptide n=1 Tax=Torenia fournieri TaxID=68875 RepID=B9ZZY2_9LAMI|nr:defensin-like cystein-rich peptide [Torenia fournieri]
MGKQTTNNLTTVVLSSIYCICVFSAVSMMAGVVSGHFIMDPCMANVCNYGCQQTDCGNYKCPDGSCIAPHRHSTLWTCMCNPR